jgi:hypothetical protein
MRHSGRTLVLSAVVGIVLGILVLGILSITLITSSSDAAKHADPSQVEAPADYGSR